MKIIVLAGIPGSGKTTMRKELYTDVPCLDMADMYSREDNLSGSWREATHIFFNEIYNYTDTNAALLIVEGIFHPGSTSLRQLVRYCRDNDIKLEIKQLQTPLSVCLSRLLDDYEEDRDEQRLAMRTYFAGKYRGGFV